MKAGPIALEGKGNRNESTVLRTVNRLIWEECTLLQGDKIGSATPGQIFIASGC